MDETMNSQARTNQKDHEGRKHYSTFNLGVFLIKVIVSLVTIYLSIAFGYAAFLPYDYSRDRDNFGHSLTTSSLQPLMDVFSYGKVSHSYDWREIPGSDISSEIPILTIRSGDPQRQDYDSWSSQLFYDLNPSDEAVILEPVNYNGRWSLIKCAPATPDSNQRICLRSNLIHPGPIRYSVDGDSEVWGIDEEGVFINLAAREYINANEKRYLLLI